MVVSFFFVWFTDTVFVLLNADHYACNQNQNLDADQDLKRKRIPPVTVFAENPE